MGTLMKSSQLNKEVLKKIAGPIMLCSSAARLNKLVAEAGFKEVSLNEKLAGNLIKKDAALRPQFVNDETMRIITSGQSPVYLIDYEMLFDPGYSIDVLKLFYELSRRVKIIIKWCGALEDGRLVYATPAHRDFHSYNINDYDIICVV